MSAEWQPRTVLVTPLLLVGPAPEDGSAVSVENASAAVTVIRAERVAILPPHRWDVASEVLEMLGASKAERVLLLMAAQTGQSIPVEQLSSEELDAALRGVSNRGGQSSTLCTLCGYVEVAELHVLLTYPERFLPASCPVCHGSGFD